jgi:hypothetical protein
VFGAPFSWPRNQRGVAFLSGIKYDIYIYIIYIWIYGTCFSQSVSHQFSQTIPMARKRKNNIYMDIFQLEVTGNIDVSIPNSNTKSGNHEELKLRFRLIFYCSYVKSSHVRYGL